MAPTFNKGQESFSPTSFWVIDNTEKPLGEEYMLLKHSEYVEGFTFKDYLAAGKIPNTRKGDLLKAQQMRQGLNSNQNSQI